MSSEALLGDIQSEPKRKKYTTCILIAVVLGLTAALIVVATHKSSSGDNADNIVYSLDYNTTNRILSFLNESADPCVDFYEYTCGNFHHDISEEDRGTYAYSFTSIGDMVHAQQLQILTENFPMISDFYNGCLDTDSIEARNVTDLVPWFAAISAAQDLPTLLGVVGSLQRAGLASTAFAQSSIQVDFHYADKYRLYMTPSGLTMPDPTEYFNPLNTLEGQMFQAFLTYSNITDPTNIKNIGNALQAAQNTWQTEQLIANISNPLSDQGALIAATTFFKPAALVQAVGLDWSQYFNNLRASPNPKTDEIAVLQADFFVILSAFMMSQDISVMQDYVRWHTILGIMQYLPKVYRDLGDELESQYGVQGAFRSSIKSSAKLGLTPAEKRQRYCQSETISQFENYLSHEWLLEDLPAGTLPAVSQLVDDIYTQIGNRIKTVQWLSNDNKTRDAAVFKWENIAKNVGPTSSWYRYSNLLINSIPLQDREVVQSYYLDQTSKLYMTAVNRSQSTPNTDWTNQNAFYDPTSNSINLVPGLMFPPFYSPKVPKFLNLATYGMVIGHEITHGFDNSGRHFNGSGAYVDWWSPQTGREFDRRSDCLINQYNQYPILNQHVDGNQTLGENIADNGGIRAAWNSYKANPESAIQPAMAKFNNDQLFFVYFAQSWCTNRTAESALQQLKYDVHSPARWRVNGPLSNLPYFAQTYGCRADQPMGRSQDDKQRCEVW